MNGFLSSKHIAPVFQRKADGTRRLLCTRHIRAVPMAPLLLPEISGFSFALFPKFVNMECHFNGHHAPIDLGGNFHLTFSSRSNFLLGLGLNEMSGRGIGTKVIGLAEIQKHPDGIWPFGR